MVVVVVVAAAAVPVPLAVAAFVVYMRTPRTILGKQLTYQLEGAGLNQPFCIHAHVFRAVGEYPLDALPTQAE